MKILVNFDMADWSSGAVSTISFCGADIFSEACFTSLYSWVVLQLKNRGGKVKVGLDVSTW
jgi:hypothetical protein